MSWLVLSYDRWKPQRNRDGSMGESFLLVGQGWILMWSHARHSGLGERYDLPRYDLNYQVSDHLSKIVYLYSSWILG